MNLRGWSLTLVASLTLPLFSGCATAHKRGSADSVAPQHEPIRVGAWNIEWLGMPGRRSGPAKDRLQTPEALAEYILAADVDVLGLEEISIDADDGTDTNAVLRAALAIVERKRGGHWEHELFPARSRRDQCCGIAWDESKVTMIDEPRIVTNPGRNSSQGKTLWSRPPRGATFSAGEGLTDFVVVVIHMKSNYGGDFSQHRGEEALRLVSELPNVFHDPDLIIIGDANCGTHGEPAVVTIAGAGFVDLNAHDLATHWRYGALDRAFVPADQPEFARQCFEVLRDTFLAARALTAEKFKVSYSDHFMVITEIDVREDDD